MAIEKRSQGFGDEVARFAKLIKANKVADKIAKKLGYDDCGCTQRQETLNNPDLLVNKIFYKNKEENGNIKE